MTRGTLASTDAGAIELVCAVQPREHAEQFVHILPVKVRVIIAHKQGKPPFPLAGAADSRCLMLTLQPATV